MKSAKKILSVLLAVLIVVSVFTPGITLAGISSRVSSGTGTTIPVHCMVAINGSWQEIKTVSVSQTATVFGGTKPRYYLTAAELEEIYADYRFAADDYDLNTTWADTASYKDSDGTWLVPLGFSDRNRTVNYIYYLPNGPKDTDGKKYSSFGVAGKTLNSGVALNNSFMEVTVSDKADYLDTDQKAQLPADQLLFYGESTTLTLPWKDGVNYVALNPSTDDVIELDQTIDKDNKTVTITIDKATSSAKIITARAGDEYMAEIDCYVAIDGTWTDIRTYETQRKKVFAGLNYNRYYLDTAELETIFGSYGFKASEYNGERLFPHSDSYEQNTMWFDAPPVKTDTGYDIPLSFRTQMKLYYVPSNTGSGAITSSAKNYDEDLLKANSFYTVKCSDPKGILPSDFTLPADQLVYSGSEVTVSLPKLSNPASYSIVNPLTNEVVPYKAVPNGDMVDITISNITCPVRIITSSGLPTMIYNASIDDSLVRLGQFPESTQRILQNGSVKNQTTYYQDVAVSEDDYTFLDVDNDCAWVGISNNNRRLGYSFVGWQVGNNIDKIFKANQTITRAELRALANGSSEITLNAVWQAMDGNERISTVNFYVNVNCEIMDNLSNGFNPDISMGDFTNSVHASRVFNTDSVPKSTGGNALDYLILAPPTSADTAYETDQKIREASTTPFDYGVTIEQLPSDESVLEQIRNSSKTIKIEDNIVPHEYITSDYFTIRWYCFKYEHSDGWHVDGVLVAKVGKITVSKTFAGDDEAIEQVKKNFAISVTHQENGASVSDYTLSLNSAESETDKTKTGYSSYDAATDTYTWNLTGRQGRTYNFKELNYILDQDKWNNTNRYSVSNSADATGGWLDYPVNDGVNITAEAYPSDLPAQSVQTVSFQNMYVKSGLLTVIKADSTTGHGLKNVSFKISRVNGKSLTLYRKPNTSEYSTDTNAIKEGYTELIENNILTTDANGHFYIKLGIHGQGVTSEQYYLTENVPTGYEGPTYIKITVTDEGKITMAQEVVDSTIESEQEWLDGVGTSVLTINNRSKLLTVVKAEKQWDNTPDNEKEPVTVELWQDGVKMSDAIYTQVLSADNNWQYEWNDLPLYVDGAPAVYTLRESKIGNVVYDPGTDTDGYADYMVTYDATLYKEGADGNYGKIVTWYDENGTEHFADHAYIKLHNAKVKGLISFAKTDELGNPLAGATFGLYSDEDCTTLIETRASGSDGFVVFSQQTGGTYYIKEIEAPKNYELSETVYKAVVRGGVATITVNDGSTEHVTKIVNKYIGGTEDFSFVKSNKSGSALGGAQFALYQLVCTDPDNHDHSQDVLDVNTAGVLATQDSACWQLVAKETSVNKIGLVTFSDLNAKSIYRLVEYKAPDGYKTPEGQWQLTFDTTGEEVEPVITAVGKNPPAFEKLDKGIAPYRLYNYREWDIPVSGSVGTALFLAGGSVLVVAGAALAVLARRRRKADEK